MQFGRSPWDSSACHAIPHPNRRSAVAGAVNRKRPARGSGLSLRHRLCGNAWEADEMTLRPVKQQQARNRTAALPSPRLGRKPAVLLQRRASLAGTSHGGSPISSRWPGPSIATNRHTHTRPRAGRPRFRRTVTLLLPKPDSADTKSATPRVTAGSSCTAEVRREPAPGCQVPGSVFCSVG